MKNPSTVHGHWDKISTFHVLVHVQFSIITHLYYSDVSGDVHTVEYTRKSTVLVEAGTSFRF